MGKKKRVAIVIPYYHLDLNQYEQIAYKQAEDVFAKHPIYLLVPQSIFSYISKEKNVNVLSCADKHFESIATYNKLMLSYDFYCMFSEYDYILIYQLDAFVFTDKLSYFCGLEYDYIGAVWPWGVEKYGSNGKYVYVGNGGFSLRKVSSFMEVTKNIKEVNVNEDIYFSSLDCLKVAPWKVALEFAVEAYAKQLLGETGNVNLFGCHALYKCNHKLYTKYVSRYGYDVEETGMLDWDYRLLPVNYSDLFEQINKFLVNSTSICIWGIGKNGEALFQLLEVNDVSVMYFVDNKTDKMYFLGKKVVRPHFYINDAIDKGYKILLSMKNGVEEAQNYLEEKGLRENKDYLMMSIY